MLFRSAPGKAAHGQQVLSERPACCHFLPDSNSIKAVVIPDVSPVHLSVGCRIELRCEAPTPLLALVHVHGGLAPDLVTPEQLELSPDRAFEVLADQAGNRCCRFLAPAGTTRLHYAATVEAPDQSDPVLPGVRQCPIEGLPIDTYRFLNASTYCDTAALMELAWKIGRAHV